MTELLAGWLCALTMLAGASAQAAAKPVVAATAAAPVLVCASATEPQQHAATRGDNRDEDEWPERDEARQSFQLTPGATVKVSGINGSVTVETAETQTAEVYVVRTARRREDLERRKVTIEQTGDGLFVRGENDKEASRQPEVRQRVTLKLPRRIEFAASGINGRVSVGEVDGVVKLSGVNGRVEVAQASVSSELSGINGGVVITITRLNERGVRVSGINGSVELRFAEAINADLSVNGINGAVYADLPNVTVQGKVSRSNFNARIGAGGAPITVSGVNGRVRLAPRGEAKQ